MPDFTPTDQMDNNLLQSLLLWITIGLLLMVTGYSVDQWQFWCFLGTYWAVATINKNMGKLEGILQFLSLSDQEQHNLKQMIRKINEGSK